ncbi:MAG: thiamine pyrophosphate-binding protein, partial [Gammaproteobacteria bacterium]
MATEAERLSERIAALSADKRTLLEKKIDGRSVSGTQSLAESLKRTGVTHLYCVAGALIRDAISECARKGIRIVACRHQQGAVLMSLAQNFCAGRMASAVMVS